MVSLSFGAVGEVFFKKPPTAIWIQGGHSPLQLFKFSLFISHSVLSLARCCKFLSTIQSQDLHDTWFFPMLLLWIWRRVSHPWGRSCHSHSRPFLGSVSWVRFLGPFLGSVSWVSFLGQFLGLVSWVSFLGQFLGSVCWVRFLGQFLGSILFF